MNLNDPCTLKTQPQNIFDYIGNILLELNGKMDLPFDTSEIGVPSENNSYFGNIIDKSNRFYVTVDTINKWHQIYDNGLKHDLVLVDNSNDQFFAESYKALSEHMEYTNSFVLHNNRNHHNHVIQQGGEKSALLLPIKFSTGCASFGWGYNAIIHFEAKYTPDVSYNWNKCLDDFQKRDLWVKICPSRYNRAGFNHNIAIMKPMVWVMLSRIWEYRPELMNTDLWDCYDAFNKLGLVWSDDPLQPLKYCDKSKFELWINPPCQWFRETTEYKFEETKEGYIGIKL